jgi:hypothetical protein
VTYYDASGNNAKGKKTNNKRVRDTKGIRKKRKKKNENPVKKR